MFSIFALLRPKQWGKNVFVLLPLLFSGVLWTQNTWSCIGLALFASICFCCWASAVYIFNDICDVEKDRQHPRKCKRPIASGKVSVSVAIIIAILLVIIPFLITIGGYYHFEYSRSYLWLALTGGMYLINSLLYDFVFRKIVLLDVFSIAFGFVLRILGGCAILSVVPSQWILICGFSMALFLGFGKRRMECSQTEDHSNYRATLELYTPQFVDILLGITATCSLMSYMLYTVSEQTIALHKTTALVYTVPFVFYGIFRYIVSVTNGKHDDPAEAMLADKPLIITVVIWLVAILAIFFYVY